MLRRLVLQSLVYCLYAFIVFVVVSIVNDLLKMRRQKCLPKSRADRILLATAIIGTIGIPFTVVIGTIAPNTFSAIRSRIYRRE
jgi:hypothetical protein